MENLEFTEEGRSYVTAPLSPNSDGVVSFQLGFTTVGAMLTVEVKIDESLPWSKKVAIPMPRMPETYCDKIIGIADSDIVRLKVNHKPALAAIV